LPPAPLQYHALNSLSGTDDHVVHVVLNETPKFGEQLLRRQFDLRLLLDEYERGLYKGDADSGLGDAIGRYLKAEETRDSIWKMPSLKLMDGKSVEDDVKRLLQDQADLLGGKIDRLKKQ
jgi:hypothetical protein